MAANKTLNPAFRFQTGFAARAGFTLIELMIVIAILGILSAVAVPKFSDLIRKSQEGATKGSLSTLRGALHIYYADNEGAYPTDDLACLTINGKYIASIPAAYAAGHHGKTTVVQNNDDWGMAAIMTVDTGVWLYWNSATTNPPKRWGDIWVGCAHTDAKGTQWTAI
jgi:general secretion pathway protein G